MTAPAPRERPAAAPPPGHRGERPARMERHAVGPQGEVITATQVEQSIVRISEELETLTHEIAQRAEAAAQAEVAYKVKFAKSRLLARDRTDGHGPGGRVSNDEADDRAVSACEGELRAHLITQALYGSVRDAMFTKGRQLEALRTIAANIRAQT